MEPWMIERLRQEEDEQDRRVPLRIEAPEPPPVEEPPPTDEESERGVWIGDI